MNTPWLNKTEYPFAPHHFDVNGSQLHYIEEGTGETILFVHGTPSWSFDYRNVIKKLREQFHCIAPDHIGFGLSDKPAHYDYATITHAETLEKFILAKGLRDITLVVHDFGGPIGFHFAIRHPDRIKRIVVLNSWLWNSRSDPDFIRFSKLLKSPLLPFLYRYLNFSPKFVMPRSFGDHTLSSSIVTQYTKPFRHAGERNGPLAFARSLVNDQDWFESLWRKRKILFGKPILLIWGMKDRVVLPKYLDKFREGFPDAECKQLFACGHFPQEEQPDQVAGFIKAFIR